MVESRLLAGVGEGDRPRRPPWGAAAPRGRAPGAPPRSRGAGGGGAGLVVEGRVRMEAADGLGQTAVIGWAAPGEVFAEAYAVLGDEPLMVDVVADTDGRVLWFDAARLLELSGDPVCAPVARNLSEILARRNVGLSRRALHTAPRTIRGKVMAYLTAAREARGVGEGEWFEVPVGRQQLADYLGVDRSALSRELGRMAREGLVAVAGRRFRIGG